MKQGARGSVAEPHRLIFRGRHKRLAVQGEGDGSYGSSMTLRLDCDVPILTERLGKMITRNRYYTDTLKKIRSQSKKGTMEGPAFNLPSRRADGSVPHGKFAALWWS